MVTIFNVWQLILRGGPMMWPLILMSVVALAVGIERLVFLSSLEKLGKIHRINLMNSLQKESIKHTLSICESYDSPFSRIFKAALLKFGSSADVIKTAAEEVFVYEAYRLKERMSILYFIINLSVLIGLLGTIIGLTIVFHSIQIRSNVLNPLSVGDVTLGVWQALFSSVAGLMVCILSFSVYSFCVSRINNIVADLQIAMAQTVHIMVQMSQLNTSQENT